MIVVVVVLLLTEGLCYGFFMCNCRIRSPNSL